MAYCASFYINLHNEWWQNQNTTANFKQLFLNTHFHGFPFFFFFLFSFYHLTYHIKCSIKNFLTNRFLYTLKRQDSEHSHSLVQILTNLVFSDWVVHVKHSIHGSVFFTQQVLIGSNDLLFNIQVS